MVGTHDVGIIGGGIVGMATAAELARAGRSVLVLEAEDRLAAHQSGRNSGVIHAGLYYRPGSLKATTCREGREAMYRFCAEMGVQHRRTGKLVVATDERELAGLAELERRGRENGLSGLTRVEGADLQRIEPAVHGVAGLWVEETGIADFGAVTEALGRQVRDLGGAIRLGSRVRRLANIGSAVRVTTDDGSMEVGLLINCAGLQCDRIARAYGLDPGMRIVPFRGEYFRVRAERADTVRTMIYPVPDPALPFLGVHLTRKLDGTIEAGPNAVLAFKREGYGWTDVSPRDVMDAIGYRGFWRMARRQWRSGLDEMVRSLSRRRFAAAVARLVPSLGRSDLRPWRSGVRAQAVDPDGALLDDFRILEDPRSVHVLNAPSPAATASLSIGKSVAERALAKG